MSTNVWCADVAECLLMPGVWTLLSVYSSNVVADSLQESTEVHAWLPIVPSY